MSSSNTDVPTPQPCSTAATPLLRRSSASKVSFVQKGDEKKKRPLFMNHENHIGDSTKLPQNITQINFNPSNFKPVIYENKVYECDTDDTESQSDFDAMSIASRYHSGDNLDDEMDTERLKINDHRKKCVQLLAASQNNQDFSGRNAAKRYLTLITNGNSFAPSYFRLSDFMGQPTTIQDLLEETPISNNISQTTHKQCCDCSCCKSSSQKCDAVKCATPKIFFEDGIRPIDYVLVWDAFNHHATMEEAYDKRIIFERNLRKEGLQLEYEHQEKNGLNFVKIHVQKEVLRRYSEILKLRMPMKEDFSKEPEDTERSNVFGSIGEKIPALRQISRQTNFLIDGITDQWDKIKTWVFVDEGTFPSKGHRFTAIYSRDKEYLFDANSPCFFTPAIRSRIVQFILDRKRFSDNDNDFAFGLERLLTERTYAAGYPLHDGELKLPGSTRNILYTEWASLRKWYRYQPLDYVKEYFGVKIGFYFAWLGFYTHMLIPAAVVGLVCFIYSCATLYYNIPSYFIFGNVETLFGRNNPQMGRNRVRYTRTLDPRPQYLARLAHVKRKQVNVVTNTMEPHVPFWKLRVPLTILSFSIILLLVTLALATVMAVVLYRMSVLVSLKAFNQSSAVVVDNSSAMLFTTCTAACINLVFIVIFNYMYTYLAEYLTEYELLRTQTEFDDSLTLKIYLLQFVNYYASIFYIAFFKGKFVGYPKEYNTVFGYRQEECGPGGCLTELCIQLAIIMIGKQAMNSILEMLFPLFYKWLNTLKVKTGLTKEQRSCKRCQPQWMKDYRLVNWGARSLFPEYLEMVLQYGFVTIFVAAFPLAPFFALLNNILEMRLDARKLLTFYRRPVSQRVRDIGVWYRILDSIGKLSVITNGFIIAFTSDFIPRLVYLANHDSLENYLNSSLSYFNTSHFNNSSRPNNWDSETVCRYPDYREPPGTSDEYDRTSIYYQILAVRLFFVLIFENIVVVVLIIVKWLIPDIPADLKDQIRREAYITNEIIIKQETKRAQCGIMCVSPTELEKLKNLNDAPSSPEQWDRVLSKSMTATQFDLLNQDKGDPATFNPLDESLHSPVSV